MYHENYILEMVLGYILFTFLILQIVFVMVFHVFRRISFTKMHGQRFASELHVFVVILFDVHVYM